MWQGKRSKNLILIRNAGEITTVNRDGFTLLSSSVSAVGLDKHPRWERAPYLRLTFFLLQILSAEVLRSSGEKREMFEQLNLINCKYFTVLSWLALPRLSYVWKFLDHRSLLDILSFRMDFILVSWEFLQLPQRQLAQHLLQATPHPHRHQVQAGLHI